MAPTVQQSKNAKAKQLAGGKAPKARVHRYLKSTESKLVEGAKSTLLLKGIRCSQAMATVLKDLRAMQAPHVKLLTKKNAIVPFDAQGQASLEFLTTKNDCSMFVLASHNKKRPNNLILGRTFNHSILDMMELGVLYFKSMSDYGGTVPKKRIGSKPLLLFSGNVWTQDATMSKLQNLLIDFYRGDPVDKLVASGVDHVIVFSAAADTPHTKPVVHQRTYFVKLKKNPNGTRTPLPHLTPCGPDLDLQVRRTQFADKDLWKASLQQPQATLRKKTKNQTTNMFGETVGRLHLERQSIDSMQGKKAKALRRAEKAQAQEERAAVEQELEREEQSMRMEFKQTYGFDKTETKRGKK
jgi:ribosome production factor 2